MEDNNAPVTPEPVVTPEPAPDVNWRSALSEEYRNDPAVNTLFKRFKDTQSLVGSSLRMPTSDAGADVMTEFADKILANADLNLMRKPDRDNIEAMAEVYRSLGRPDDTSGYVAGEGVDATVFGAMAAKAHELGLSKHQYEEMSLAHAQMQQGQMNELSGQRQQGLDQLQGEWGAAYNEKVSRAGQLIKQMGGHEALEAAIEGGNIDAQTLRIFDAISQEFEACCVLDRRTPEEAVRRAAERAMEIIKY